MLSSFRARNFRGLRDVFVETLGRINLVAGQNNSGKTALLEALYLHCQPGSPQAAIRLYEFRGVSIPLDPPESIEDTCGWLFTVKQTSVPIELLSTDLEAKQRTLTIRLIDGPKELANDPDAMNKISRVMPLRPDLPTTITFGLILRFRDSDGHEGMSFGLATPVSLGWLFISSDITWHPLVHILSFGQTIVDKEIELFSELEASNRQEELLAPLRFIEPRLRRLSLLAFAGKVMLHCDIGLNRLLPVAFMGEGFRRLMAIILAIVNSPGGVTLIDEIDTGLHHSVLKKVFEAVELAARRANVQVFATTRSYECIRAAHEASTENPDYDLRLHRIDRDGVHSKVISYDRESLETSLDLSWEVR